MSLTPAAGNFSRPAISILEYADKLKNYKGKIEGITINEINAGISASIGVCELNRNNCIDDPIDAADNAFIVCGHIL